MSDPIHLDQSNAWIGLDMPLHHHKETMKYFSIDVIVKLDLLVTLVIAGIPDVTKDHRALPVHYTSATLEKKYRKSRLAEYPQRMMDRYDLHNRRLVFPVRYSDGMNLSS